MFITLCCCYCNSSVETLQHQFVPQGFGTVFTLMPENTFGIVSTFRKMEQNFAEMQAPEEPQVTLSKWISSTLMIEFSSVEYLHFIFSIVTDLIWQEDCKCFLSSGKFSVLCTRNEGFGQDFHCNDFSCFLEVASILGTRKEMFSLHVLMFMLLLLGKRGKNRMCPTWNTTTEQIRMGS